MKRRDREGQVRIVEAIIAISIIIAADIMVVDFYQSTVSVEPGTLRQDANRIIKNIGNSGALDKIASNETGWENELEALISTFISSGEYFNLTVLSAPTEGGAAQEQMVPLNKYPITNIEDISAQQFKESYSVSDGYTVSIPVQVSQETRLPVQVILVADISASMDESMQGQRKIDWVKQALTTFLSSSELNNATDRVGLVSFSDNAWNGTNYGGQWGQPLTNDFNAVKSKVSTLTPQMYTFGGLGLQHAVMQLNGTWVDRSPTVRSPTSTSGGWSYGTSAFADSTYPYGTYAYSNSNKNTQVYGGYGFSLSSETITQVRVRLDAWTSGDDDTLLEVYDGSSWLPTTALLNVAGSQTTYWVNVTGWTSWTPSKVNSIQTRVTHMKSGWSTDEQRLDWIPVEVTTRGSPISNPAAVNVIILLTDGVMNVKIDNIRLERQKSLNNWVTEYSGPAYIQCDPYDQGTVSQLRYGLQFNSDGSVIWRSNNTSYNYNGITATRRWFIDKSMYYGGRGYALEAGKDIAVQGVKIYTIGFGVDQTSFDPNFLKMMATERYYYAATGTQLEDIFKQIAQEIGNQYHVETQFITFKLMLARG